MLTCEEILTTLVRPTADESTETRTYKAFFDLHRSRTESYWESRFEIIGAMGERVENLIGEEEVCASSPSTPSVTIVSESKNVDIVAYEFCRAHKLLASLDIMYNQIVNDFTNLKGLQADYFVDPELKKREGVVFRLLIKGNPKRILKEENIFYSHIANSIPLEHRKFFSLVYSVR